MLFTLSGIAMVGKAQYLNAELPIVSSESGSSKDPSRSHIQKAELPIEVMPSGSATERSCLHPAKAPTGMARVPAGTMKLVAEQSQPSACCVPTQLDGQLTDMRDYIHFPRLPHISYVFHTQHKTDALGQAL